MTEHQIAQAKALGQCRFLPGSSAKRFARQVSHWATYTPERDLTEKQSAFLESLTHHHRKQIADLVRTGKVSGTALEGHSEP